MRSGVVLFAHGSRDPAWAAPFRAIEQRVAAANPQRQVALAFLELMAPSLRETVERLVDSGCTRITIVPLFMAQGAHLKRDLGRLIDDIRARHPQLEVIALPAAGESGRVMEAIGAWIAESLEPQN